MKSKFAWLQKHPMRLADGVFNAAVAILFVLIMLMAASARAQATEEAPRVPGGLMFKTGIGEFFAVAPLVDTNVTVEVTGVVARTRIVQRFENPTDQWLEGIYVFPLPEDSAVDSMEMRLGEQIIVGELKPKETARKEFEAAKEAGQRASLIEQERPNMFTASVANIPPGEKIVITIAYQEKLAWRDNRFEFRLPMVVAPRYLPPLRALMVADDGAITVSDPVPDRARVAPPIRHPLMGKDNPVTLSVALDAGFPLESIDSDSHAIVAEGADGRRRIALADGRAPADRDFELHWTPVLGANPQGMLFRQATEAADYFLMMVMPPASESELSAPPPPRDVVFVVDKSGSMSGDSIAQAKRALRMALARLKADDRFNVIRFDNQHEQLFPTAVAATARNVELARRFVADTEADGGTEMLAALRAALKGAPEAGRIKQIVFLTDGAVGNEEEMFRLIVNRLGESRLFTIGIGSAPNSHFMTRAARLGRGSFTYIDNIGEAEARMKELFRKLEAPAATDLQVAFPNAGEAEIFPNPLPDLYLGEPLVATVRITSDRPVIERTAAGSDVVRITGVVGGRPWDTIVPLGDAADNGGIAKLWARDKIAFLEETLAFGTSADTVRDLATEVAMAHGLMSRYTSLVAVDRTPLRPDDEALVTGEVPTNLPDGWDYEKVTDTKAKLQKAAAPAPTRLASADLSTPLALPQTATAAEMFLLAGAAVLLAGIVLMLLAFTGRALPAGRRRSAA